MPAREPVPIPAYLNTLRAAGSSAAGLAGAPGSGATPPPTPVAGGVLGLTVENMQGFLLGHTGRPGTPEEVADLTRAVAQAAEVEATFGATGPSGLPAAAGAMLAGGGVPRPETGPGRSGGAAASASASPASRQQPGRPQQQQQQQQPRLTSAPQPPTHHQQQHQHQQHQQRLPDPPPLRHVWKHKSLAQAVEVHGGGDMGFSPVRWLRPGASPRDPYVYNERTSGRPSVRITPRRKRLAVPVRVLRWVAEQQRAEALAAAAGAVGGAGGSQGVAATAATARAAELAHTDAAAAAMLAAAPLAYEAALSGFWVRRLAGSDQGVEVRKPHLPEISRHDKELRAALLPRDPEAGGGAGTGTGTGTGMGSGASVPSVAEQAAAATAALRRAPALERERAEAVLAFLRGRPGAGAEAAVAWPGGVGGPAGSTGLPGLVRGRDAVVAAPRQLLDVLAGAWQVAEEPLMHPDVLRSRRRAAAARRRGGA